MNTKPTQWVSPRARTLTQFKRKQILGERKIYGLTFRFRYGNQESPHGPRLVTDITNGTTWLCGFKDLDEVARFVHAYLRKPKL